MTAQEVMEQLSRAVEKHFAEYGGGLETAMAEHADLIEAEDVIGQEFLALHRALEEKDECE